MNRRSFLLASGAAAATLTRRDKFGGCPDIPLTRTGYFHLEKKDRWWMVTPEGSANLGFGLNHAMPPLLTRPECVDHWAERFGVRDKSDMTQFAAGYRQKHRSDLNKVGMNHLGVHSSIRDLPAGFVPYIHTARFVDICHYIAPAERDFHDVFSADFAARCDRIAQVEVEPRNEDPYLIGYFMIDCPIFTDLDAAPRSNNIYGAIRRGLPTWPRVAKPGRAQRRQTRLRRCHADAVSR
jgi:hypothetical protein